MENTEVVASADRLALVVETVINEFELGRTSDLLRAAWEDYQQKRVATMPSGQLITGLKQRFEKELDADVAIYELGAMLGFWPEEGPEFQNFRDRKWIVCSNNPVEEHLAHMLNELVDVGALIKSEEATFTANQLFDADKRASEPEG